MLIVLAGCALGSTATEGSERGKDASASTGNGGDGGKGGTAGGIPGGTQGKRDAATTPPTGGTGSTTGDGGGADASVDGAVTDAGGDAGTDAGVDAGMDAGSDSGTPPPTGTPLFGGAYSAEKTDSCPVPHDCHVGNPLVVGGTTCGCPAAYPNVIGPFHHLDDRGGAGMPCAGGNPPYGWASSSLCYAGAFDMATTDFGGAYHKAENGTCIAGNPLNGSACTCPTGSQAIELFADHACYGNSRIGLCWNGTAPRTSFCGAYLASDNASYGSAGCVVANPATGGCSCPIDCDNIAIRSIYGPSDEGACTNSGAFGAQLNICRKL